MKTFDGYKKQALTDVYALLAGGGHKPLSEFSMAHTHPYLPLSGGTMLGSIKFNSNSLPQKTLSYICGIDAFADGGEMGWMRGSDFVTQYAPTKTGIGASGTWGISITGNAALATNADKVDGYHASSFVKIKLFRFSQYNQGTWTKILTITINSTTDLLPVIAFSWIPSECNRDIWADFSINWRSNSPIFYAIWKGMNSRTLKVVNSSGAIWDVWVSGNKTSWDPFGEIQVTYTHNIISYNGGSLGYSDTDPGGTICITGGQVNYATYAAKLATARSIWGQSFNGTNNVSGSISGTYFHIEDRASNPYFLFIDSSNQIGYFQLLPQNKGVAIGSTESKSLIVNPSGNVGIGTNSPTYKLYVTGDIYTTTGFKKNGSSDSYVLLGGGGHKTLSDFATSGHNHDGRYLRYFRYTTSPNADSMEDGWHDAQTAITNAPTANHGTLILNSYNGTPFQIFIPDASYYIYKRYKSGSIGGSWTKIYAGYADSAGNASTATKLTSSAGNAALPIYFSDGKPVACTASSVFSNLSNSGNNISVTVAGQNRTLTVGYASNSDTVDRYHILEESRQIYRYEYTVTSPEGAWILIELPAWNANNEIVTIDGWGNNRQAHCIVHCGSRNQGIWGYQSDYNGTVVDKIRWRDNGSSGKFAIVALINRGITTLKIRATSSLVISKTTEDTNAFAITSSFFSSDGIFHGKVDWDKVIGKPSSFTPSEHTHPYLPLIGGTMTGIITGNTGNGLIIQSANTGSWKEGLRIYPASNNYSVLSLQSSDSRNVFAMVTNVSSHVAYFDYCKDGNLMLIHMPYKSGTLALTSDNVASATKLQTARTIWGQSFNGTANVDNTLRIRQTTGNYCEGIRIQTADGAWSTIILGATADSGTNTNAWSIHRKADNNFAISRNSSDGINGLVMTSVGMGLGTTAPTHRLDVRGDTKITGSIRDLAIGGGIYWNPYVESTTDGSDVASITVVKSGVAGGTTLVLRLMNDANDTILFLTSTAAKLYHNSYPILTTLNTYVSNNKGYINGVEITLVNNASSASTATKLASSGYANNALSYYQTDQAFDGSTADWAHYIIANHHDGASYFHYTIRLPFWSVPQYRRQTGSTSDVTSWYNFITAENIGSQSVKYANSAGNADKVDGQHFNWNNNKNDHTYLWAASNNGNAYLVHRASISVNYANSAGNADTLDGLHANAFATASHSHPYLPLSGGTMTGLIVGNNKGGAWISGRSNAALYLPRTTTDDWHPVVGFKTKTGSWEFGNVGNDDFATFSWESDSNYSSGTNTNIRVNLRTISGTIALTSDIPTKSSWNYDDRYYTKTESDNRFVNITGDTMTGSLYINSSGGFPALLLKNTGYGSNYVLLGVGLGNDFLMRNVINGASIDLRFNSTSLRYNEQTVWHSGNDGSGSGLDADTVDGNHASAFATSGHTHDRRYMRSYDSTDVAPASTHGYWSAMTTQSGITSDWWHIIHTDWNGAASWRSELALPTQGRNGIRYRSDSGSGWTFGGWVKLLDENNYTSYCAASSHNHDSVYSKLGHTHDDRYYTESEVNTKLGAYLPLSGGTMTGVITSTFKSSSWINGVTNAVIKGEYTDYGAILSMPVKDGRVSISSYPSNNNHIYFGYATTALIKASTNSFNKQMYWDAANNKLVADTFLGALYGNATTATTATKLSTSSAGSASLPVYFSNGIPVACTKSSIFSNLSNNGNQLSVTVAGLNRLLTVAYASRADSATNANYATNADALDGYHALEFSLSDHAHTLKLECSTKNNSISLTHGCKYELTAGGSSIVFTLSSDITSIAFSGGLISSSGNTLTQADHSITIDGQTRTAGSSNCNIINSLSVSTLSSTATTNLSAKITVNGVTSALKTITQLHSRFWDVTRNSTTSNISPGNYSATITEVQGNASGITGNLPTTSWYHVYTAAGSDTKYATLLALGMTTDGIWYRKYSNSSWGSWLTVLHSGNIGNYYWANISISSTQNTNTTPRFGQVKINTDSSSYQLNVDGDSYTTGWSRAKNGFYCEENGVYFTHNNSLTTAGEIDIASNNEFCWGSNSDKLYFNYRGVSRGTTVTSYIWNAGSPSSYASHTMGNITATSINASDNIYATHFYENSDIRYKKVLRNLLINSNTIANLPLFDFEWIENNAIGTGTSALAVLLILPNLVSGTDKLTLDYGVLGTIAGITACKELVTLKSELLQLKEKVKLLEDKLRKYENI